jgi:hypothetical protein
MKFQTRIILKTDWENFNIQLQVFLLLVIINLTNTEIFHLFKYPEINDENGADYRFSFDEIDGENPINALNIENSLIS